MNRSEKWDKEELSPFGRINFPKFKTILKDNIDCEHITGVMIPQRDINGNYVKPQFMICDNCRMILKKDCL